MTLWSDGCCHSEEVCVLQGLGSETAAVFSPAFQTVDLPAISSGAFTLMGANDLTQTAQLSGR